MVWRWFTNPRRSSRKESTALARPILDVRGRRFGLTVPPSAKRVFRIG
jgi:hypothetical protein